MSKTIGLISIKGGVGKTTIAASLASDLSKNYGKKVLLVDGNFSAPNLGLHMNIIEPEKTIHHVLDKKIRIKSAVHNRYNVDVIPGNYIYNSQLNYLKLKNCLKKINRKYDFTIIDSSPSLNEELLSAIIASDSLFVITTPDWPTLSCSLKIAKLAKQRGRQIQGIIINRIQNPRFEISLQDIEKTTNIPVVAYLPEDKTAVKALFSRMPIPIYNPKTKFAKEINKLNSALTGNKEKTSLLKRMLPFGFKREEINRQLLKESFYSRKFLD